MSLTYLNGIEGELGKKSKAERKEARKEKKEQRKKEHAARKAERKEKGGLGKRVLKGVAKVGLAPSRAAFLEAVSLNFLKLGKRMQQAWEKDRMAVENFWKKFGGDVEKLKKAIEKGSKSKLSGDMGSFAAIVSACTPIIIAVVKLFKELKSDKAGDDKEDEKGIDELKDELSLIHI